MRNTEYSQAVAAEVRAALARLNITQQALAAATGIKPSTMHRRVRGLDPFLVSELACVADALGVDVRELLPRINGDVAA